MFNWIQNFDLLCFDFDGLLVNTEDLHYEAYKIMLLKHGYHLPWSFQQYCLEAHLSTAILRNAVYGLFPDLEQREPSWETLRQEKQKIYQNLIEQHRLKLMPGVGDLLKRLHQFNANACVVTNSTHEQVDQIRKLLPELNLIKNWLTREDYTHSKPKPDGYLKALQLFLRKGGRAVGFEDTMKGVTALIGANIHPVLIRPGTYPPISITDDIVQYKTFLEIGSLS
ncbi:MAG: HAD family phosphatase [Simkaniaceae bacterium]|nr:HAD family phosphatase [Simkaniaceae bacterium]MCF7851643.1 HAD family phosphatase [Simkaniaceae bacterium]